VNTEIPTLKKYDEGEITEGVGAGAALSYAKNRKFPVKHY
jgi:NaMN:DMB phosphoribosyltransferase